MPSKNIIKQYGAKQYYHIYSRGIDKQTVFLDDQDFTFFLSLFKRYLSHNALHSKRHGLYPYFGKRLNLITYCLMPNHIHLLVYQHDDRAMIEFMRSLMTSYSMYFNRKYKRVGPVFQSRYKASLIDRQNYLEHISRYIHLNPKQWADYEYSSIKYFLDGHNVDWLYTDPVMSIFDHSTTKYRSFLSDYEDHKQMLEEIKWELANNPND